MVMKANKNTSKLCNCRSCGKEVSFHAEMCPNCGDKHPTGSGCGCWTVIIIIIISMIVIMGLSVTGNL